MSTILETIVQLWNAVISMIIGGSVGTGSTAVTATSLTSTITNTPLLILGIVAVPLCGIAVGMLRRLFSQRV